MVVGDLATAVEVLVLGGGPGGYVAAIRAAQLGKQVTLVTDGPLGGTCLNAGCIPAKALLHASGQAAGVSRLAELGITTGAVQVDFGAMQAWKDGVVQRLSGGVGGLLAGHKVEVVHGRAWFVSPTEVRVQGEYGSGRYSFSHCIIATGATPAPAPGAISPQAALALTEVPAQVAVVGSDYVAAELATIFARLGAKVTLDTAGGPLLPEFDPQAGRMVAARLKDLGVTLAAAQEGALRIDCARPLPRTDGLELGAAGIAPEASGAIPVDQSQRTAVPTIYAVGDVTGGPLLATVAIAQGKTAAEALAGQPSVYAPQALPTVAYTDPEVAAVGLTQAAAKAQGLEVTVGRFPFGASGRALTLAAAEGTAITVADAASGVLLGVTLVGARAGDLIGEAALALELGATLEDLALTLHAHPGLGEVLQESAEAALGRSVHLRKGL